MSTRNLNLEIPGDIYGIIEELQKYNNQNEATIVSMALKYYKWLVDQTENDFKIVARGKELEKELNVYYK